MIIRRVQGLPVWHVRCQTQYDLAMTFLRAQEHYESPKFRRKVFDLEAVMDREVAEYGRFIYTETWTGFNVPSWAVRALRDRFSPHSRRERRLLDGLVRVGAFRHRRFYVIGTYGKGESLDHEIRHALWYCNAAYRREMQAIIARFPAKCFRQALLRMGYSREVLTDEMHAYALTGWPKGTSVTKELERLRAELKEIEKRYV